MGKTILLLLISFYSFAASAQQDFIKFVGDYYRVDPFSGKFQTFLKALSSDKSLLNKKIIQSDDDYEVSGDYKVFNPFGINATLVQMNLKSLGNVMYFGVATPMYVYEITARFDDTPYARKKIKKDFWLIANRFRWLYITNPQQRGVYRPLRRKDLRDDGDSYGFWFKGYLNQSASRVSWQRLLSSDEIELKVAARFAVIDNQAYPLGHYPGRVVNENHDLVAWKSVK